MSTSDTVVVKAKPILTSWTVIFNVLAVLSVVLLEVQDLLSSLPEGIVPEWVTKMVVITVALANIALRIRTKIPVVLSTQPEAKAVPAPTGLQVNNGN